MRGVIEHRQRGQSIAFAAVAMVAVVGAVAIVIDAGIFFVVQRQLQTAADAGALAGAWHDPICPNAVGYAPPCQPSAAGPPVDPLDPTAPVPCPGVPGFVACDVAQANANTVAQLCGGSVPPPIIARGTKLIRPANVNTIVVTVQCDAGYSFGRILNLTTKRISASAAAALGNRQATPPLCNDGGDMGNLSALPPCGFIARLID